MAKYTFNETVTADWSKIADSGDAFVLVQVHGANENFRIAVADDAGDLGLDDGHVLTSGAVEFRDLAGNLYARCREIGSLTITRY